jgi:serine/threonine protein kinase
MAESTGRAGQLLGNYRIIQLIGQGGFADVYLGEHVHLNTLAAIKVLRTRLVDDSIEYFRSEARTVAHLLHPNIVRVLDFGVESTIPFLVMEYAPNGTLRQRHPRGIPVPIGVVVPYVKQIAAALQYAHNEKFIHRDIKPENILLGRNNEVLLSDFGIAVVTQSMRIQMVNPGTSDTAGTASYMAPEQIMGEAVPASDQYALAVVIYEWLTGVAPFNGTYIEVVAQHMNTSPPALRGKAPYITPDVEQVILTALNKEPGKRFARVESFANALEQAAQAKVSIPVAKPFGTSSFSNNAMEEPAMEASLRGPFGRMALRSSGFTIGRSPDNGLVINDMKASTRHAEIRPEGPSYAIVDLDSTNGTFVNDQRLPARSSRLLQAGDVIRVGDTTFLFEASSLPRPGPYSFAGPTVREVPPNLEVATNFGEDYGAMRPNFGEIAAAQNSSYTPPQYTPVPPVPSPYTPSPPQYTPPPPQYTPAAPSYGQAQYTAPQLPLSPPPSQTRSPRNSPSLRQSIILAAVALLVIIGAISGFFVFHNHQIDQQNASATAIANAYATGTANVHATATAIANATATAIANATVTAIANANATATAQATSQYPPFTILALNDALTANSASGWNSVSQCQFTSAGYQVSIAQAGFSETCFAGSTNFSNFAYQVTMTITKGDCGGLVFRAGDNQNYYAFYVCVNGRFNSILYVKGASAGSTNVASSSAIHTGLNQANTLAVVIQGNTYNLYANGQNIDSFTDGTFTHGAIGVLAVDITSPTAVNYTNALVWTAS